MKDKKVDVLLAALQVAQSRIVHLKGVIDEIIRALNEHGLINTVRAIEDELYEEDKFITYEWHKWTEAKPEKGRNVLHLWADGEMEVFMRYFPSPKDTIPDGYWKWTYLPATSPIPEDEVV